MSRPPLAGVRIIECSMLGPGAITTHLADLGADVIKVEPPAGDYIREMTWPIVEGVSLMHLHISRGKRSITLDLRTEEGREVFRDLVRGADAVVEAMRPGGLDRRGVGYEALREVNPAIVFITISGYGMTGPYKDMPSHGLAYDTWAGLVNPGVDDDGFAVHPRAPVDGHPCRSAVRRARHPRRRHPGPGDRRGVPHGDRPGRRRRRHGLVPQRVVEGLRAAPERGDRQQVRQLRASRPRDRRHAPRRPLPDLRVQGRLRAVPGVGAGVLGELLHRCRPARPVRAVARRPHRRPRPRQPGAPGRAAGHLRRADVGRVDRLRRRPQHPHRPGQHAADPGRRPPVPGPAALVPAGGARGRAAPIADQAARRGRPARARPRPHRRPAHRRGGPRGARLRRGSVGGPPRRWRVG